MAELPVRFSGFVPYLHFEDAAKMLDWYARVFGFEEKARWLNDDGSVRNAEMALGDSEFWLDGSSEGWWEKKGHRPDQWIGVWVDDPDAMHARITAAGVQVDPPTEPPWGPYRILSVSDPEGYTWGFMRRIDSR